MICVLNLVHPIDNPPEYFREVMMSGYGLKDDIAGLLGRLE